MTDNKSKSVGETESFLGGTVRQAENRSIWKGEKQELFGRKSVFFCGVSGRRAVERSGEAAGMSNSAEDQVGREFEGRLN